MREIYIFEFALELFHELDFSIYFKKEPSHEYSIKVIYATSCFLIFYDFLEISSDGTTIEIAKWL